jgi:aspartyl-tRNA(Asn)/glutamyl-tRNA(Gln) amidotransferase subunit B
VQFETVIGLEVHVELGTESKIFCNCSTAFGAPPNTNVCPVCLGHPGVLPVVNERALELAVKAAMALNCEISTYSKFDRKNYFYPDLPKAFQTSQYDKPVGLNGYIEIEVNGDRKRIGITRVHLEEDAGKSTHTSSGTLVDYNRVGVPLIEIVSEPDIRTPEEARLYLEQLKAIMQYCEISDCKMEEGSLRCDANISLRPQGESKLGTKTELKNMNSFRNVQRGLEYEQERQREILESGGQIVQETRRWDEATNSTISMRGKEEAHDYRYFPEPDLVTMVIDKEYQAKILATIPELPEQRRQRFIEQYGLPPYDAGVLTASKDIADFLDEAARNVSDVKLVSNWIMGELLGYLNQNGMELRDSKMSATQLGQMIVLLEKGTISSKIAKTVFKTMMDTGQDPEVIIKEQGLVQISDEGALAAIIEQVIANNPKSVEDYLAGKEKAIGALVGQVMKETKGKANPQLVNKLLIDRLKA